MSIEERLEQRLRDVPDEIIGDEQYRACFVAYLMANDIWVDTWEYDNVLSTIGFWRGRALTEDEENYLIEYIV